MNPENIVEQFKRNVYRCTKTKQQKKKQGRSSPTIHNVERLRESGGIEMILEM